MRYVSLCAAAIAASFALSDCSTLSAVTGAVGVASAAEVTKSQLDILDVGYVLGAQTWINAYVQNYDTTPCAIGEHASFSHPCSEYAIVVRLQAVDAAAGGALDSLEAAFVACAAAQDPKGASCSGLVGLYNLAVSAVAGGKKVAASFGYGG